MFIYSGGYLLNCVDFGSGESTFVAHGGWTGSWELWQQPFQLMKAEWRCISYDHRGSSASTAPANEISPQSLVDDLFTVLDRHNVERCVLAGESLGALTASLAVIQDPSRFLGLVIVDGTPSADRERMASLIDGSRANYAATVQWFVDACIPEPDSEHLRRWGRQILTRADPEAAARILECHAEQQISPQYSKIDIPTLIIHGEMDAIIPLAAAQHTASQIPNASLVTFPGAGHVPSITRPAQLVDTINEWWQRVA